MNKKKEKNIEEKEMNNNSSDKTIGEQKEEIAEEIESGFKANNEAKIIELEEKIIELEEKIIKFQDSLLRKAAEFENYKRRTENDQLNLFKYAAESFILKILPVYDDLGRSVDHLTESNIESFKEGLKLVYDKFTKILEEQGVKKLEVKGKEFDVDYHEALMQQPTNEVASNTVVEEIEAGYIYKDKVIKHAKVVVSQEIENQSEDFIDTINDLEE